MSRRDRERTDQPATQNKHRSKSNKRTNKSRRLIPQLFVPQRREKPRACTADFFDQGCTSDYGPLSPSTADSPYEAMRNTVQAAVNSARMFDMEKNYILKNFRRSKLSKGDDPANPFVSPTATNTNTTATAATAATAAAQGSESAKEAEGSGEGKSPYCANSRPTGAMAGNEDDEEYQMEEEEAERIISQEAERIIAQGLSLQEMTAVAYQTKKSIAEQLRELQVCIMERAAKKVEARNLLPYFRREGYFHYSYDQDARTSTNGGIANGTKKDTLYIIIGLNRKAKVLE